MKKNWFTKFQPKSIAWLLVITCLIREIRLGYFKKFREFIDQLEWRPYWQIFSAFLCLSALFTIIDPTVLKFVQGFKHPILEAVEKTGAFLGKNIYPWLILGGAYWILVAFKRAHDSRIAFGAMLSSILASIITFAFKYTVLRARPYMNKGQYSFFNTHGIQSDQRAFHSFPSGDTVVVAAASYFCWYHFKDRWWSKFFLVLPFLTAYSRMYLNKHWFSDTWMALGLGLVCATFIHDYWWYTIQKSDEFDLSKKLK